MLIGQLLFSHITFVSSSEFSLALNISSLNSNTNSPIRRFLRVSNF